MNLTREEMGEHGFNGEDGCRPLLKPKKELHEPQVESQDILDKFTSCLNV